MLTVSTYGAYHAFVARKRQNRYHHGDLSRALVEEAVSVGSFVRLLSFEGGKARLAEVRLAEGSPADGKEIVELGVPRDATVVAVLRADRLIVPRGDTVLRTGDEVVVLVTDESEADVRALLVAPAS